MGSIIGSSRRALLLGAALVPLAAAPPPAPDGYRTILDTYRLKGASAVDALLAMSPQDLARAVDAAAAPDSGLTWRDLRAAVMLHSEAALRRWRRRELGPGAADLQAARRLLDRLMAVEPVQRNFGRRWHTLIRELIETSDLPKTAVELQRALHGRWPADEADAAYEGGIELEVRGVTEAQTTRTLSGVTTRTRSMRAHLLEGAAREYMIALERNPRHHAAALHLGRLRLMAGDAGEATRLLQRALDSPDPRVRYLAQLFLGSLEERGDRMAEAERYYRDAWRGYPEGQSAPLALAQLLSRTGREEDARAIVEGTFQPGREPFVEPLWTYLAKPHEQLAARFNELRVEVWQ